MEPQPVQVEPTDLTDLDQAEDLMESFEEGFDEILAEGGKAALAIEQAVGALHARLRGKIRKAMQKEAVSLAKAQEIMGREFLGPEAVKKAWGIDLQPESIPPIPFTLEDLERAKELGQFLILRVDKLADGSNVTMQRMYEQMTARFAEEDRGKVLYDTGLCQPEKFFTEDNVRLSWALQTKDVLPGSTSKDHLTQTELLAQYLKEQVFNGRELSGEDQAAILEFETQKAEIRQLIEQDKWQLAARRLSSLKINQLFRRLPCETIYDFITYFLNSGERILKQVYDWSSRLSSDGGLVDVGRCDASGAYVFGWRPVYRDPYIGVSFSRSH